MRNIFFIAIISLFVFSCSNNKQFDPIDYVNPLIGTGGHGHTYPGATSPFGMVQLSPDTRLDGWDGCSGYHFSDSVIYGFSHTHLSGTGVSDYGDILLMPINGNVEYNKLNYSSSFSHANESVQAGYYKVKLDKHNIEVELTTSPRSAMHHYVFPTTTDNKVILDLNHRDYLLDAHIHQVDKKTLKGYRISKAWAQEQAIYFYIQFSQEISLLEISSSDSIFQVSEYKSNDIVASIQFDEMTKKELFVKVGVSAVDMEGAKKNLLTENSDWNFEDFRKSNQDSWRKELNKIVVEDKDNIKKTIFYTALYHNLIVPNLFSDVDGRYRGMDGTIHKGETDQYTIFSLWDTYRATHPLYTIIDTKRTKEFISTFQKQYHDGGKLPIWELAGNYTGCMIGYHSIPVITDAYLKGNTDINVDTLLNMMLSSADHHQLGLEAYKKNGYISIKDDAESVSKTLEYAFDDWCIAQVAKKAGKDSIYEVFMQRAQSYKNIFDPNTGYMRPKLNETWKEPFDPSEVDFNYTEANSWQYSFYVPQDIYALIEMMGGAQQFEKQLDDLFSASTETTGRHQSDITGLIGQYAHGNEPSHHMAYLYNYINQSEKTQKYVQQIMDELYTDQPDGLCGNEDCGQMSAWYVFSAMGFYPVNPANGEYVFGKPLFDNITINLEDGKHFTIEKTGYNGVNSRVKEILLNGEVYSLAYIKHEDIMKGGVLTFKMDIENTISFDNKGLPHSQINDNIIIPVPSIRSASRVFRQSTELKIEAVDGSKILYSINDGEELEYEETLVIDEACRIKMRAVLGEKSSKMVEASFYRIPDGRYISIENHWPDQDHGWHKQYPAGGNDALIDGLEGTPNFRTGAWQGYYWEDFTAVVDLGKKQPIKSIKMNCIQDSRSWIWMPSYVEYLGSNDSINYEPLGKVENNISKFNSDVNINDFKLIIPKKEYRYIKIFAKNHNLCPEGHLGEGHQGWIFMDEIIIE